MATSRSIRLAGTGTGSGAGNSSGREGSAKTAAADQITQAVLSTSNLLQLMLQSSPSQGQLMKLPKNLLAKTSTIKHTELLLRQMPRVISELDAHMDNGFESVSHLKTVIHLLENIESSQLKSLQKVQLPKEGDESEEKRPAESQQKTGFTAPTPPLSSPHLTT